jgi:uncharacterized protein (DUF1778 family)
MSTKAGRPKVPKKMAKAPGISIRLMPDERKAIDRAIDESGLSQSEWVRKTLISASKLESSTV